MPSLFTDCKVIEQFSDIPVVSAVLADICGWARGASRGD